MQTCRVSSSNLRGHSELSTTEKPPNLVCNQKAWSSACNTECRTLWSPQVRIYFGAHSPVCETSSKSLVAISLWEPNQKRFLMDFTALFSICYSTIKPARKPGQWNARGSPYSSINLPKQCAHAQCVVFTGGLLPRTVQRCSGWYSFEYLWYW